MKILPYRGKTKQVLRLIIIISTILCSWSLHEIGEPGKPLIFKLANGLIMSIIINIGWFAATFEIKSFLKYFVAIYLFPAALGVGFAISSYSVLFASIAILLHLWLIIGMIFYKSGQFYETATNN